jgi:sulfoxide reductase heme-binding subunit YedZ
MQSLISSKYTLWLFLSIPITLLTVSILNGNADYDEVMHTTGELSTRLLVFTLIATPLVMLLPKAKFPKWLMRNRRYLGVAAFAYALLHTIYYLYKVAFEEVMSEFLQLGIITGWIAFFVFVPLAITSNDYSIRLMKKNWKKLQRWVYLAGLMVIFHWRFIHGHWGGVAFHFVPVAALQLYRVWKLNSLK